MSDNEMPVGLQIFLSVVAVMAASVASMMIVHRSWTEGAIKSGHGRYHPTTGNFEWLPVNETTE